MNKKLYFIMIGIVTSVATFGQSVVANKNATVVGWFAGNPPKLDGKLNDAIWTTPYSNVVTTGQGTSGAGFANGHFPNKIDNQININDNGVVAPAAPAGAPASSLYNTTASFGIAWDNDNLYIAGVVYEPNWDPTTPTISAGTGLEMFVAMDPGAVSKKPSTAGVWPPVLNSGWEGQVQFNYRGASVSKLTQANGGWAPAQGMQLLDSDGEVYTAPYSHPTTGQKGYVMEMAIKWSKLNSQWISPATGLYTDASKVPAANRLFRFDLSNNIYNAALTSRVAQTMWNMCCYNDNYQEADNYGTVILSGLNQVTCPTALTNTCPGCVLSTPNGKLDISDLTPTPGTATTGVVWSIVNPDPVNGLVANVASNGIVTALNNGVVTVTGTSTCTTSSAPIPTKVVSIITVSGQVSPTSLSVNTTFTGTIAGNGFTDMWGYVAFTANVLAAGSSQEVTWSVASPGSGAPLATINSVTGVLRSTSIAKGVVTVTATSVANKSVSNFATLTINPNTYLQDCNWYLGSFTYDAKCRTYTNTTFAGYTSTIAVTPQYYLPGYFKSDDSSRMVLAVVPSDLITWNVRKVVNVVSTAVGASGDLQLSNVQASGIFTITGTYKNDPSVPAKILIVRLNSAAVQLTTATGCKTPIQNNPGCVVTVPCVGTTCPVTCTTCSSKPVDPIDTTTGINTGSSVYQATIYPNPTDGGFTIEASTDVAKDIIVSVVNLTGSTVYTTTASIFPGTTSVPVGASLPSGIYLVRISSGNSTPVIKRLLVK
ncbi:MAG: T9SS type A sorting domain-containing protein [Bacteroidota bacterium]|nr:T9SS type A sorting domain-containing protein [Bacteroidota bacterium]